MEVANLLKLHPQPVIFQTKPNFQLNYHLSKLLRVELLLLSLLSSSSLSSLYDYSIIINSLMRLWHVGLSKNVHVLNEYLLMYHRTTHVNYFKKFAQVLNNYDTHNFW